MSPTELKKIKKLAVGIDWKGAFQGRSTGNKHLFRVIKIATYLARKEDADISIVQPAAWLHDSALPSGNDYQYRQNKRIAMKLLSRFKLSPREAEKIAECIASHEGTARPKTLEAEIIHDADALEKCGILGFIRHTWKIVHRTPVPRSKLSEKEMGAIISHVTWRQKQLHTTTARCISRQLSKGITNSLARRVIQLSVPLAVRGLITERIAEKIAAQIPRQFSERLKDQLALRYLI